MRGKRLPESRLYVFRLPPDLVARIDAHAERLQAERAGSTVSRADALRALVLDALEARETRDERASGPFRDGPPTDRKSASSHAGRAARR